jgi:NADH:ubiquinone oxidoreductase subunit 2 (subunit N)
MPTSLVSLLLPELIVIVVACALFMLGLSTKVGARRFTAWLAMLGLGAALAIQMTRVGGQGGPTQFDGYGGIAFDGTPHGTVRVGEFTQYVKLIVLAVGMMLTLLAWPTNATPPAVRHTSSDTTPASSSP